MMLKIGLIVNDSLQKRGLLSLFDEFFPRVEIAIIQLPIEATLAVDIDLFVVDALSYIAENDFFTTRRNRCIIVISGNMNFQFQSVLPKLIDSSAPMECIVDNVSDFINGCKDIINCENIAEELSAREIQVLTLIVRGSINKEIASELGISINTVLTHRKNITAKLGVKTVSGLTLYALMHGYING